jgi:transketolase
MNRSNYDLKKLTKFSLEVRKKTMEMIYHANASHIGSAFSMVELLTVLYNCFINISSKHPADPKRDRFLLSKGHACTSLYSTLAILDFFDLDILRSYGSDNSILMSHVSSEVPGVEFSTGSLGHALPVSLGIALAAKKKSCNWKTIVLMSDGELNEGSNWEAFLMAPQMKLNNLIVIIDNNKMQALGNTDNIINLEPLELKFHNFGWQTSRVNGHNLSEIYNSLLEFENSSICKPKILIADTIKGKGISFMENSLLWHYHSPDANEYEKAMKELMNA